MTKTIQDADSLTLDLIKQHLYIDTIADDILLEAYKVASLGTVQKYLSSDILKTTWGNTDLESVIMDSKFYLNLQYKPYSVTVTSTEPIPENILHKSYSTEVSTNLVTTIEVDKCFYSYINDELVIDVSNIVTYSDTAVLTVGALTGDSTVSKMTELARLMLIAGWYANREPSTNLQTNKVPYNVGLLLDLESNSVI